MEELGHKAHPPSERINSSEFGNEEPNCHFETIFNHIVDGVLLAGVASRRLFLGNPAMCQMLGYSADEIRHLFVSDIHPTESLPSVLKGFEEQTEQRRSLTCDVPVRRKDGSVFYADINAFPLTISGKTYLIGIFRDITQLKQAQQELAGYRQKMVRAERLASIGALSAAVAHEMMQPLTVITLSLQNAMAELESSTRFPTAWEALRECQGGVREIVAIVERFRHHAQMAAPQVHCTVDLGATVKRTVKLLTEQAHMRRVSLIVAGVDDLPALQLPERSIEQICFALIDNAIQAADGESDHSLVIKGQALGEHVALWFEDDCCGMPRDILDKIFIPFFSTKSPAEGTGLGLCLVERMVSSAGGRVYVESRLGKGSTFCVTLPMREMPYRATGQQEEQTGSP